MFVMTPNDSHRWHGLSLGLPYINRHSCRLICQPWIIISRRFFNIQTLKEKNSRSIQHRYTKDCWHRDKEHSRTGLPKSSVFLIPMTLAPWPLRGSVGSGARHILLLLQWQFPQRAQPKLLGVPWHLDKFSNKFPWKIIDFYGINGSIIDINRLDDSIIPSGKRLHNYWKSTHFSWEISL